MLLIGWLAVSCQRQPVAIVLNAPADFIPEGIAVSGSHLYLSSVTLNKIVDYDMLSEQVSDFVSTGQFNFASGVGLFARDSLLYAVTNHERDYSALFVFDIRTKSPVRTVFLRDTVNQHFLNDLAVSRDGHVYVTDTEQHLVYRLAPHDMQFEKWMGGAELEYPNGITLSDDGHYLYVASSTKGIRIVDTNTRKVINEDSPLTRGVDGVQYFNGQLLAIMNGSQDKTQHGLYSIELSPDSNKMLTPKAILVNDVLFDVPTTVAVANGKYFLIANSHLGQLGQNNVVTDRKSLRPPTVLTGMISRSATKK